MAIEFNYYNFKRQNQLKYEVDIDLSGLIVKSNPTVSIIDGETGEATETNLDEIKDEKVNFVYTGAFVDRLNSDGKSQGSNEQPLRAFIFNPDLNPSNDNSQVPVYTVGETLIDTQIIDYRDDSQPAIVVSKGAANASNINPTFYDVRIIPRHELMKSTGPGNFSNRSDVSVDIDILAALGLWSNNAAVKEDDARGFIDRKTFLQRISNLQSVFDGRNIGIELVEYPKNLLENGMDLNESYLSRDSQVGNLSNAAEQFINDKESQGNSLLAPLTNDDIIPFTLSVKEGFRGWYDTKDELYNTYLQQVKNLTTLITEFPFASAFVDDDKLNSIGYVNSEFNSPSGFGNISNISIGNGLNVPIIAFNTDVGAYQQTYKSAGSKVNVYQLVQNPDENDRWEFLLVNGKKVFIKEIRLNGTPKEIIDNLLEVRRSLVAGVTVFAALGTVALGGGAAIAAAGALFVSQSTAPTESLEAIVERIKRYEVYTNESVFPSNAGDDAAKFFFTSGAAGITPQTFSNFEYDKRVARVLVPVDFGFKRSKRKKKLFGFSFTDYVYEDLGVRWVYVNLIDTSTFTSYRRNLAPSGKKNYVNSGITNWAFNGSQNNSPVTATITTVETIDLDSFGLHVGDSEIFAQITNTLPPELNGFWQAQIVNENTLNLILEPSSPTEALEEDGVFGEIVSLITPFQVTQPDDENTPIRIDYNIPFLPDDDTLRNLAFEEYGPFDQSEFAVRTRSGGGTTPVLQKDGTVVDVDDDDIPSGWEIFHESSRKVQDMRDGIGIYNKVNFLLRILNQEFGESRVRLVETTRSLEDQNNLQLGGPSSNFLSWHNYGLAVRIIITRGDSTERIEEGSEDFWKLFTIAESFTAGAINGDYGEPCTVVWCARLVAGSDIFDWEFLPIGVGHKDVWKFRDAAYRQQDPYYANAYVNVNRQVPGTNAINVLQPGQKPPLKGPYIFNNSKAYKSGVVINNEVYVDPNLIPRYQIPSNLVLKDLQEFLYLIQNRQDANGTDIGGRRTPDEWKSKNPRSYEQLIQYYGMIGNFSSARTLISGDYIRKFEQLVISISKLDPVTFVRAYLGEVEYQNARIIPEDTGDNSFISLATGKYTTPVLEVRSIQPEGSGNTFGQQQVDFDSVEFGQYRDGVFIPEDSGLIIPITTEEPVLSGYIQDSEGNITIDGGDAFILHSLVADQIVESFDEVKQNWQNIDFKVMHDRITESPNARVIPVLENEFGTIMSQDLLTFSQLRDMYQRMSINNQKRYVDSGVLGVGVDLEGQVNRNEDQSVFEKLVSNAQLSGIKKVKISNETLVEDEPVRQIDVEKVVNEVNRRNAPNVRDIL